MIGAILPRPIAWVSSADSAGRPNLAPFSFFTAVCAEPPTIVFCPMIRDTDSEPKDTLRNIRDTGVFIVNFVTEALAEKMNITSVEAPAGINEFERAGLTMEAGQVVNVPRVAESPIHFECRLNQIVTISDAPGGGSLVIGTIVHMHIADSVYRDGNHIDLTAYQPIGRLAGAGYTRVSDVFEMQRPPSEVSKPG
ncbi:MAG: flavin reductase family protein [Anaerolineae bacterium]|nr:flavin reductase family protein [Anaerolineae bacterium]